MIYSLYLITVALFLLANKWKNTYMKLKHGGRIPDIINAKSARNFFTLAALFSIPIISYFIFS